MVPIQVVEREGFKQLVNTLDPRYTVPKLLCPTQAVKNTHLKESDYRYSQNPPKYRDIIFCPYGTPLALVC